MQVAYVNIDLVKNGITEALCVAKKGYKTIRGRIKNGIFKSSGLYKDAIQIFDYDYSMSFMLSLVIMFEPDVDELIDLMNYCLKNKLYFTADTIKTEIECRDGDFETCRLKRIEGLAAYLWFMKALGIQNVPAIILSRTDNVVGIIGDNVDKFLFVKPSKYWTEQ